MSNQTPRQRYTHLAFAAVAVTGMMAAVHLPVMWAGIVGPVVSMAAFVGWAYYVGRVRQATR